MCPSYRNAFQANFSTEVMKIFVGQIYITPGVKFPFSLRFQKWFGDALSERTEVSERFCQEFGTNFILGFRISAKEGISKAEIKGPTVFKRDKSVEFTIFLPHTPKDYHKPEEALCVFQNLLQSTVLILEQFEVDTLKILRDVTLLESEFLNTPGLLEVPKTKTGNLLMTD